jgi:hypothetical protein
MSPGEKFAHRLVLQAVSPGLELLPERPSLKFIHHLILDEVRRVRCNCLSCTSPRPAAEGHVRPLALNSCRRLRRCLELVRQHEALIEAAYPSVPHPFAATPPAKEVK